MAGVELYALSLVERPLKILEVPIRMSGQGLNNLVDPIGGPVLQE
jgi:hypothetical protein